MTFEETAVFAKKHHYTLSWLSLRSLTCRDFPAPISGIFEKQERGTDGHEYQDERGGHKVCMHRRGSGEMERLKKKEGFSG